MTELRTQARAAVDMLEDLDVDGAVKAQEMLGAGLNSEDELEEAIVDARRQLRAIDPTAETTMHRLRDIRQVLQVLEVRA